jgi:signal transduction histidine kinase
MDPSLSQTAELAWTRDGRITHAAGACERVFGRPSTELEGTLVSQVLGISEKRAEELARRAHGQAGAVEFLTSQDRTLRIVLAERGEETSAGVLDLDAVLAGAPPIQISGLSSSLSHEIRNPLSSVKMAVQTVAKNEVLSERDQRRLRIANREIRTIERMLSLLSEYGRTTPAALEPTPLHTVLSESIALVEPELAEREIHVELRDEDAQGKIRVEMARLRPVIAQLLLNVASGLAAGSTMIVRARSTERGAEVLVPDPTAQVPPEERAMVFVPFGSPKLARGAGLSLAALYRAMISQGGAVTVEERTDGGIEFRLVFAR